MSLSSSAAGVRTAGQPFVAGRRDLREEPWQVGLFVQSSRSRWKDRGLSPERQARCCCGQGLLSQGNQGPSVGSATAAACIKVTYEEMDAIDIARNHFYGEWN